MPVASVVIPAHNEAATIGRNLTALRRGTEPGELDVVVVCNGCTDATAEVARRADPRARVIEIPEPSKVEAVRVGNAATSVFPRVHLDADVELTGAAVRELLAALDDPRTRASSPGREVPRAGCSLPVRWYYDVWERLPHVRTGLFGRGVVAVDADGQRRLSALPRLLGDDLGMSEAFEESERVVVAGATAVVRPPLTVGDLLRRRIRIATGNAQADAVGVRTSGARTTPATLLALVRDDVRLTPKVAVFVAVHLAATVGARRAVRSGDFTTWRRDESSRTSLEGER